MYYRRDINILDGGPDDPTRVWEEFARIRKHLMSLDQNNVQAVRSKRIAPADDPGHHGISDIRTADTPEMANLGLFPYRETSNQKVLTHIPDNRRWAPIDEEFYLDLFSKWEADWFIGVGCEVSVTNPSASPDQVFFEVAIHSSVSTGSSSSAATTTPGVSAISNICPIRVPAGPFRVYPLVRASWANPPHYSTTPAVLDQVVTVLSANMYAFGIYR